MTLRPARPAEEQQEQLSPAATPEAEGHLQEAPVAPAVLRAEQSRAGALGEEAVQARMAAAAVQAEVKGVVAERLAPQALARVERAAAAALRNVAMASWKPARTATTTTSRRAMAAARRAEWRPTGSAPVAAQQRVRCAIDRVPT